MKTPKQTYHSRSLQEKAKIIEEHLNGVSKAKLMENYKIPRVRLARRDIVVLMLYVFSKPLIGPANTTILPDQSEA